MILKNIINHINYIIKWGNLNQKKIKRSSSETNNKLLLKLSMLNQTLPKQSPNYQNFSLTI